MTDRTAVLAEDADLPMLAHDDPALAGDRFHEVLDELASRTWLVRSDLGYLVLGREPGLALLRDRRLWPGGRAALQAVFDMDMTARRAEIEAAYQEVREYVLDHVTRRRQQPGEDLLSALIHHEQDGDRLSDDEIVTLAASVISGGTDTTESQLAHGLRLFADHPDQRDRLGDDPALAEQASQEVLSCAATGNRDPLTYAEPGRFDITADRGGAQVLSFGMGSHFCAGASLAKAEITEALAFLAPRMRDLKPDGEAAFGTPTGIYAMSSLPVKFVTREASAAR